MAARRSITPRRETALVPAHVLVHAWWQMILIRSPIGLGSERTGHRPLHVMLTTTVYAGVARFNWVDSRSGTRKAETEHITAEVPIIIDPPIFGRVQSLLKARNPRVTPPRVVSRPILLTGLAYCATGSGAMTLRAGTSKTGKVHKYYSRSTCVRQGKTRASGVRSRWTNSTNSS